MKRETSQHAFTLLELLSVMAIMGLMVTFCLPALRSLQSSGSTNKAIADLANTLELARAHAMACHTYVRLGMVKVPAEGNMTVPATVVVVIAATDGSLANDSGQAMSNDLFWQIIAKPLVLNNFLVYDSLDGSSLDTSGDLEPSNTDIPAFSRKIGGFGNLSFNGIVQFNPAGEARVIKSESARFIKIGMDQPQAPDMPDLPLKRNSFLLRLSGINGGISILRKESL